MSQAPLTTDSDETRAPAPSLRIDEDFVADLSRYTPSLNFLPRLR